MFDQEPIENMVVWILRQRIALLRRERARLALSVDAARGTKLILALLCMLGEVLVARRIGSARSRAA